MATVDENAATDRRLDVSAESPLPKDDLIAVLQSQPADSTYEELLRELHTRWSLRKGLADVDAGRTIDHEEVKSIVSSWSK